MSSQPLEAGAAEVEAAAHDPRDRGGDHFRCGLYTEAVACGVFRLHCCGKESHSVVCLFVLAETKEDPSSIYIFTQ